MANRKPPSEMQDHPLVTHLTKAEKDAARSFAKRMGMSLSNAARHLMKQGLADNGITFNDEGEEQ